MKDFNNVEIKTGDIVEIRNAYFKKSNGLYFVTHSPGDCTWVGKDHCLRKIKRNGEMTKADNIEFWPLCSFCSDRAKNAAADVWNAEHATIEIKAGISTCGAIEYFTEEREVSAQQAKFYGWNHGEDSKDAVDARARAAYYNAVINAIA